VRLAEESLSVMTHNLIHQRDTLKEQDSFLRVLEVCLDLLQDHLGTTPFGLSSDFEAPTLNGRVALLADKFVPFDGSKTSTEPRVTEVEVLKWVNRWWSSFDLITRMREIESFLKDCESFLGNMVASIHAHTTDISTIATQVAEVVKASTARTPVQPSEPLSRFSSMAHSFYFAQPYVAPTASTPAQEVPTDLRVLVETVRDLQAQVKVLSAKLSSVSLDKGNHCVIFGNAGFRGPCEALPLIQAQMPTSYFGCFVNSAILLEWILGNNGEDTLKKMERMHKLKTPSLPEVHALKGLESSLPRLSGEIITFTGRQNTSYFTKVPSASVWTNGSTGTKEFILTNLSMVVEAVRATINQRLLPGKELHTLATLALESSSSFIMSMVSFIEENRESYALLNYPDAMQWSLNTRFAYRVWKEIRPYCGVDSTPFKGLLKSQPEYVEGRLWESWSRCFMGCKLSPYISVRFLYLSDEFCRGDKLSPKNPMRWDVVKLNLPCSTNFDPRLPRVMKWCKISERIAGDVISFMDDERGSGHLLENAWQVHRQYISK
jgi:hypothetical protein